VGRGGTKSTFLCLFHFHFRVYRPRFLCTHRVESRIVCFLTLPDGQVTCTSHEGPGGQMDRFHSSCARYTLHDRGSELIPAYTNTDRTQIDMEMDMETWRRGPPLWTVLRLTGFNFHEAFFSCWLFEVVFVHGPNWPKSNQLLFFFFASLLVAQDWPVLLFFFHLFPFEYVPISSILV
jgi:hypothetical protein